MPAERCVSWPASHLRAADLAYAALTCGPDPLALDCAPLADRAGGAGMPAGVVPLPRLREWLLSPDGVGARDLVWRELILRARRHGQQWTIAAVGMAMPALVRICGRLVAGWRGEVADIENEVLTGFLEALRDRADLTRPGLYASLPMAGWRAGRALRLAQDSLVPVDDVERWTAGPRLPDPLYRHPDLLVHRAAVLGVIDAEDVQPWIEVRLGRQAPEPIATRLNLTADALRMRLARADARLAAAVTDGLLSGVVGADTRRRMAGDAARRQGLRRPTSPAAGTSQRRAA